MDIPEAIPIPQQPEVQKNLTPAAVKRSEPPIFNPERDGTDEQPKKKRKRGYRTGREPGEQDDASQPDDPDRGRRIDILA